MTIPAKAVIYRGAEIGRAATTREAARLAKSRGCPVNPTNMFSVMQYIGEGPTQFYAVAAPGERFT